MNSKQALNVLSLFDGISCGRVALEKAGLRVGSYYAYEIEPAAIAITQGNYPDTIQCGDVFAGDFRSHGAVDLVIGGSPCTYWSIAQKAGRRETTSDGLGFRLFQQYIRALEETGAPWFLYENNYSMSPCICAEITAEFNRIMEWRRENCDPGSEQYRAATTYHKIYPVFIDSATVSAQQRKRLYWTNIPKKSIPEDAGITLQSILEHGTADRDKSLCICRKYSGCQGSQSFICRRYFGKRIYQGVFEGDPAEIYKMWKDDPYFHAPDGYRNIRRLSVTECERLQTLPDGYTAVPGLSDIKRIQCIGNGWTVDVIAHLLSGFGRQETGVDVPEPPIPRKFAACLSGIQNH